MRKREDAARAAQENVRREREAAIARAKHLDSLVGRDEEIWLQVERLVEARQATPYAEAVEHLKDLRDLAARANQSAPFAARLRHLRDQHLKKQEFIRRLDSAGLR